MHPLILHFHLDPLCTQSAYSIAWFSGISTWSLSCEATGAPTKTTFKIKPTSNPWKWWKYYKQVNKKTLQHMKVWQIDQQKNPTKYESIANRLAKKL
jgi:hypothetical protein